jgi:hypothetical protein
MPTLTLSVSSFGHAIQVRLNDEAGVLLAKDCTDVSSADITDVRRVVAEERDRTDKVPDAGRKVGAWLLPAAVLEKWKKHSPGNRTLLNVEPQLADIPWELAFVEERRFIDAKRPFLRIAAGASPAPIADWPLDILVVLGSTDDDLKQIGGYDEVERIRAVFRPLNRTVDLTVLAQPSRSDITRKLVSLHPHVLHFIGHGSNNGLQLASPTGYTTWNDQAILADLSGAGFTPPLVYLNACRSTTPDPQNQSHFAALPPGQFAPLAEAFFGKGARAVVAMQADIEGKSAAASAEAFYASLAKGDPVDKAMALARLRLDQAAGNIPKRSERRDAYLPVLMVSGSPDDVLPAFADKCAPPAPAYIAPKTELPRIVRELVNHDDCRRAALRGPVLRNTGLNLHVVHGAPDTGKSWLLGWCIDGWLRRQFAVRYIPMHPHKHWLGVLETILKGQTGADSLGALSKALPKALKSFEAAIGATAGKGGKTKWPAASKIGDPQEVLAAFHSACCEEAGEGDLLLVLDQFSSQSTKLNIVVFETLWRAWIEPMVLTGDGRVCVILGLSKDDMERYKFQIPAGTAVSLEPIPQKNYLALLRELLAVRYHADYDKLQPTYDRLLKNWKIQALTPKALGADCDQLHEIAPRLEGL